MLAHDQRSRFASNGGGRSLSSLSQYEAGGTAIHQSCYPPLEPSIEQRWGIDPSEE